MADTANKLSEKIFSAGSSIASKVAQDRVRDQFSSSTSGNSDYSMWDMIANTVAMVAFFFGTVGLVLESLTLSLTIPQIIVMILVLVVIFMFDLPSLAKRGMEKAGCSENKFLTDFSEKLSFLNQLTKGLLYLALGIVVIVLLKTKFIFTGILICASGGLHVYISKFLKGGAPEQQADAENQF